MEIKNSNFDNKFLGEYLTFDDVLLVPSYSEVLPREVDISTQFTRNLRINVPIVSAAMDTVTEKSLAIAIARQGGIGIIHKNMTIAEQAEQVRSVKRSESGLIVDPVTLHGDATVGQALELMKKFSIGGIPIVNAAHKLIGILTNRDLRFESQMSRKIKEVMTTNGLITAPIGTTLAQAKEILQKNKIEKLPVTEADGTLVGLITYKDMMRVVNYPNSCRDEMGRLVVGASLGVTHDTMERVAALVSVGV
ncbi:MAG: IMP dehydrogenase, partial [Bacteroidia bacterium]